MGGGHDSMDHWGKVLCFECAWPAGSGTVRQCGLIAGGVALLEEVCHCGGGALR